MKNKRKLAPTLLAISVASAVISLGIRSRFGVPAVSASASDFAIASAHTEITHETAAACAGQLYLLNFLSGGVNSTITITTNSSSEVSCAAPAEFFDGFQINAEFTLYDNDFGTDLSKEPIAVKLAPASCETLALNPNPAGSFTVELPGDSFMVHSNPNKTIYTFDGNVAGSIQAAPFFFGRTVSASNVDMEVTVPDTGTEAYFHLHGNGSLCALESGGEASLTITMGGSSSGNSTEGLENETDSSCIDITPQFDTTDVSESVCHSIPSFLP